MQNCLRVRELLMGGAFGNCPEEAIKDYEQRCRELFPLAAALQPPDPPPPPPPPSDSASVEASDDREKSDNSSEKTQQEI